MPHSYLPLQIRVNKQDSLDKKFDILQISSLKESLSATQLSALTNKSKQIQDRMDQQMGALRSGGLEAIKGTSYIFALFPKTFLGLIL